MATFTVEIADGAVVSLQALVTRYNADNGTDLTVEAFLSLNAAELSVQDALLQRIESLQRQTQADLVAAITAEKERLLSEARIPA